MPDLDLSGLQSHLLRAGVAPRHVRRTVSELQDHYDDLLDCALAQGDTLPEAQSNALREIGDVHDLAAAVRAQPELRDWTQRMPYLALVIYPMTCIALLPAAPILAGVAHASDLARWLTCIFLGGVVTATLFLVMQLSIALT